MGRGPRAVGERRSNHHLVLRHHHRRPHRPMGAGSKSDLITDEMVETTAEAQWRYDWPLREFHREPDDIQDYYRTSARVALETVAPLIAAKAWEEGYTEGSRGRMCHTGASVAINDLL